jgi:hypothetical protein
MQATKTMSVPEAGLVYFGLGRNASYDAARRGEIPIIRVGRLVRVPVAAMERMLDEAGSYVAEAQAQRDELARAKLDAEAERRQRIKDNLKKQAEQLRAQLADVESRLAS